MILMQPSFRTAGVLIAGSICLVLFFAWRADRRDRAQLAAELTAAKQSLAQADARQHARDAQLQGALAAIAAQKRTVTTPAQILRALPQHLPLPQPITIVGARDTRARLATSGLERSQPAPASHPVPQGCWLCSPEGLDPTPPHQNAVPITASGSLTLPGADLKPIYDFALDCQACQAKLATAQGDLADEKAKAATLTKERDAAIRTARGGSALRRAARAAKWFLIGAAAGAIAATAHR